MSIVGPRPERPEIAAEYEKEMPEFRLRLQAKDYISFLGWVDHSELQNKVKNWKYLLFPTDTEGMPNE